MNSFWDTSNFRILIFGVIAFIITAGSLLYSNHLAQKLLIEEQKRVELYARGLEFVNSEEAISDPMEGIGFVFDNIIKSNTLIPTVLTEDNDSIISAANLGIPPGLALKDSLKKRQEIFESSMRGDTSKRIVVKIHRGDQFVYYDESRLLKQLQLFPYLQLLVIVIFISVIFGSFFIAKKNEQNRVWVGLAKETAHQLGTPVSSLMAWVELLRLKMDNEEDEALIVELEKDVDRLKIIAERFSKIGSKPELTEISFREVIENAADYTRKRMSKKVSLNVNNEIQPESKIAVNRALFDWVIENLLKNALDAIPDKGEITITGIESDAQYIIDVSDTGKGIPRSQFKQVFKAGFTTKKRGWGLGLSLTKRIVENYHRGKIFVKTSEVGKGTTFRVILPKIKS